MKVWLMTIIFVSSGAFRILKNRKKASVVIPLADAPVAEGGEPALFDDEGIDVGKLGAEQGEVAPESEANETNIQSCKCSSMNMYSYQQWPRSPDGYGCVGTCRGNEFQVNRASGTITQLSVWINNRRRAGYIRAIRFTYNDGHSEMKGETDGRTTMTHYNFQPGEYVVGDLKLSGSGRFQNLGYIEFQTSAGKEFKAGITNQPKFLFPSGGSYLGGFTGRSDWAIQQLGVIFWKPIRDISYVSLTYPTLDTVARIRSPEIMNRRSFCNIHPIDPLPFVEQTFVRTVRQGTESCLKSVSSNQFSKTVTVSGSIPMVAKVRTEHKWVVTASSTRDNCKTKAEETTRTLKFPAFLVAPREKYDYTFSQWSGRLSSLPFTAILRITLTDGTSFNKRESGTYTGVSFTAIVEAYSNFEQNITWCP